MTHSERISSYVDELIARGELHPGDRLPKYTEMMKLFNVPYITVQHAFKSMEYEGKIKIVNGVGSFLNGGDTLDVDFYVTSTTFDLTVFQQMIQRISDRHELHLRFHVQPKEKNFCCNHTGHKVTITETDPWMRMDGIPLDYSSFPDYEEFRQQFRTFEAIGNCNLQLPFYVWTYQGVIHTKLEKKLGLKLSELSDFSHWDQLVHLCQSQGVAPAALDCSNQLIWHFPLFSLSTHMMLQERQDPETLFASPFYTEPMGQRILDMAQDCCKVPIIEQALAMGQALFLFSIGSWMTVQAEGKFHVRKEDFRIVPLRRSAGPLMPCSEIFLETFVNPSISGNERQRIWKFLKILLSKRYQRKICAMTGAVSPRKDMKPEDHAWATREDFLHFFPTKDTLLYSKYILSREKTAVLSSLYELYESAVLKKGDIARFLDAVLAKTIFEA